MILFRCAFDPFYLLGFCSGFCCGINVFLARFDIGFGLTVSVEIGRGGAREEDTSSS